MKTYAAVLASVITIVAILGGVFITKISALSSPERYFQKGKRNYEIENYQDAINNLNEYLSKLKNIDWLRSNPDWVGRTIRENGKVLNSEAAIALTCSKIKQYIELPLSKEEQLKEAKFLEIK